MGPAIKIIALLAQALPAVVKLAKKGRKKKRDRPRKKGDSMPETIRRGSTGPDVVLCQDDLRAHGYPCTVDGIFGSGTESCVKAFQSDNGLVADGIVGPATWAALQAEDVDDPTTWDPGAPRSWSDFSALLPAAAPAIYSLTEPQVPEFPPGVDFLPGKYLGGRTTNCSMFTAYFLGNGFGGPFTLDQWNEWQVAKGANESAYKGYGPWVTEQWGVGKIVPEGSVPSNGVYLIQSFTTWPRGHSWLVIDYDEATDKILTLESNTSGSGLNGVGFGGLGPIRSTNAANWVERTTMTWAGRTKGYSQIYMAKLGIDPQSVKDWITEQG